MPDESRAFVVHRVASWARRLTVAQAAGLIAGATLSVVMLYAASAAADVPARATGAAQAAGATQGASATSVPTLEPLFDNWQLPFGGPGLTAATPTPVPATATASPMSTPTSTATTAPLPTSTAPPPAPAVAAPPIRQAPAAPVATPTPVPPPPAPTGLDTSPMDGYAQALFDATNRRRAGAGVAPLRVNGWLIGIARIRSQDMAQHGYFAHVSPVTGDNAFTLMDKYGVPYGWAGENLAENNYPLGDSVSVADDALWNSPPHRENILNHNYTDIGIALAVDAAGMKYFTIIFTGPG